MSSNYDWGSVGKGALDGAGKGAAFGSAIMPGWGTAIGGTIGGIAGGIGSMIGNKPTKTQRNQQQLMDQLMASINGGGPYADLFNVNEDTFNKSFKEPMMNKFQNEVSPQIQQQYISSGQQRGTGMESALTRAGVNMDDMLNSHYQQMQESANSRKASALGSAMNFSGGVPNQSSWKESIGMGVAGAVAQPGFGDSIAGIFRGNQSGSADMSSPKSMVRKGFEPSKYSNPNFSPWG